MGWVTRHFPCFHSGMLEHVRVQLAASSTHLPFHYCAEHMSGLLGGGVPAGCSVVVQPQGTSATWDGPCVTSSSVQSFISAVSDMPGTHGNACV